MDKTPPAVTGSPADGDTVCTLRPPLVVEYSDELSGIDPSTLSVLLDGTNIEVDPILWTTKCRN